MIYNMYCVLTCSPVIPPSRGVRTWCYTVSGQHHLYHGSFQASSRIQISKKQNVFSRSLARNADLMLVNYCALGTYQWIHTAL